VNFAEAWADLEERAPEQRDGRMVRRVHPESPIDLYLAVELHGASGGRRRILELDVAASALADHEPPAGTRQVEVTIEGRGPERSALVFALDDPGARDLFAVMCVDIAEATSARSTDEDAIAVCEGRFAMWRRMLQGGSQELRPRRQRGLFAELMTIRDHLVPVIGFDESVRAWMGPDGAPRDFEVGGVAVETKSSAANEPQLVPVHGERQLDDSGLDALVLLHQSLEVLRDMGETLPGMVQAVRALGEGQAEAGTLEDRLLQSGYVDLHAPMYLRTGYEVRRTSLFLVSSGFPRITEVDLMDGVGSVRYSLAIDACRSFEADDGTISRLLR
jgi:Putative  PD-(D/E)XK family member, (DUF4420)